MWHLKIYSLGSPRLRQANCVASQHILHNSRFNSVDALLPVLADVCQGVLGVLYVPQAIVELRPVGTPSNWDWLTAWRVKTNNCKMFR